MSYAQVKFRKNGQWVDGKVYYRKNGQWVKGKVNFRKNGQWVGEEPPKPAYVPSQHTKVWDATWTAGYWSWGAAKGWSAKVSPNKPIQGCYVTDPARAWDQYDRGDEGGMIGFDDGDIRRTLSGARIDRIEVYLYAEHWYYYNGGTAIIGTHNAGGWQSHFSEANHGVVRRAMGRQQGMWIQLPNWVGDNFKNNLLKGITVKAGTTNHSYYGYFSGTNDGNRKPKLRITYTK